MKILLIEPNEIIADVFERLFRSDKNQIIKGITSGEDAKEALETIGDIDLVVCEQTIDGFISASEIKEIATKMAIRFVLVDKPVYVTELRAVAQFIAV